MLLVLCFSACRILHYELGYLFFIAKKNVKIARVYWNRHNFTTTCRKIYALFAAHSVITQQMDF
jgi:DNA-binding XRE family transcriptional regulator